MDPRSPTLGQWRLVISLSSLLLLPAMTASARGGGGRTIAECVDADGNPPEGEDFCIIRSKLPFVGLANAPARQVWGVVDGAGYRIEVPRHWNGDLVMYAHGFRGPTAVDAAAGRECAAEIAVSNPPIREYLLSQGFAWAASSYHRNCYDVKAGVEDTNALVRLFRRRFGRPHRTFITGQSMGGHITGAAIEQLPNYRCPKGRRGRFCRFVTRYLGRLAGGIRYDGAVPMCGNMGDVELFEYFLDYVQVGRQLTLGASAFPPPTDFMSTEFPLVLGSLTGPGFDPTNPLAIYPFLRSPAGEAQKGLLQNISGGPRPMYEEGFLFWESFFFLFGLAGAGDGSIDGITNRVAVDNTTREYQLDTDPALSAEEVALNAGIGRVAVDPRANRDRGPLRLRKIPVLEGNISQPVVSIHTLGDLFVPFSMEQIWAREVASQGNADLLVSRATRDIGHCASNLQEQVEAFSDMVTWVNTGVRPAGDDILDPATVAAPDFGCQFTRGDRPNLTPCP
ncbi:MAG: alpha/beta hydrolase [Myxococcota bacterium]